MCLDYIIDLQICHCVFGTLCPCRQFALLKVVNVVKRVDKANGSRYLLELVVTNANGEQLRLSHYVYVPLKKPEAVPCNPVGLRWNPEATVHFIVPGIEHAPLTMLTF